MTLKHSCDIKDILIIGGGLVGATLAVALALTKKEYSQALVDAAPEEALFDPRLIALTPGSVCLFKNLDIWPHLVKYAEPIKHIHVSKRGSFGSVAIHAAELDLSELGFVVPAKYINAALYSIIRKTSAITLLKPAQLQSFTYNQEEVSLQINLGEKTTTYRAKKMIGADGNHSLVRQLLNIPTRQIDYHQSAIVTMTTLKSAHENVAYERFQHKGAIAMLPLQENKVATIWTDDNAIISDLMTLEDEAFIKQLQKNMGYRLGRFLAISQRSVFPLQMIQAKELPQSKLFLLLGNAAHTLNPIAAQGLNLSLYEVAALVENLQKNDFSLHGFHHQYQKSLQLSHYLPKIFASDFFMLPGIRPLGMLGLDSFFPAKKFFAKAAMQHSGKIPALLLPD